MLNINTFATCYLLYVDCENVVIMLTGNVIELLLHSSQNGWANMLSNDGGHVSKGIAC